MLLPARGRGEIVGDYHADSVLRSNYTVVHGVCRASLPFGSGKKVIAVLQAYFDESGHIHDRKVLTIAAMVSTEKKWLVFTEKWSKRLRRDHVAVFRMSNFEDRRGEFNGWDDDRRTCFISDLAAILKNSILFGVAHSVVVEDWNAVMRDRWPVPFERKRAAYIILLQTCMEQIAQTHKLPGNATIASIFEQNDFIAAAIQQQFLNLKQKPLLSRFVSMSFAPKGQFVPLQAADMWAFESYKHILNQKVEGGQRKERKLHANLRKSDRITGSYFDSNSWLGFLDEIAREENA